MGERKIYKVAFKEPPMEGQADTEFFFGSLSAIFETFTVEQIGCGVARLWAVGVGRGVVYANRRCTVYATVLHTKPKNAALAP